MDLDDDALVGYRMLFEDRDVSLCRAFRHEIGNPLTVIQGYLGETERLEDFDDPFLQELDSNSEDVEDFLNETYNVINSLDQENWVPPQATESLKGYRQKFNGKLGEEVEGIVDLVEALYCYQEGSSINHKVESRLRASEITDILEEGYGADVNYSVPEDTEIRANEALRIVPETTGQNWIRYGSETGDALNDEEAEIGVNVYEEDDYLVFEVGDNGPGLNGRCGGDVFEKDCGDGTGFGLYFSQKIAESMDGSMEYSQEAALDEKGFGYKLRLEKV